MWLVTLLITAPAVAKTNLLYDLEDRLQSEDRAHRIGQTNKVTYIDIITKGTIDEKILQALRNKINISSLVMAEGYKEWII